MSIDETKRDVMSWPQGGVWPPFPDIQEVFADHSRLEAEVKAVREENARLRTELGHCVGALQTLPQDQFGVGGGQYEGDTQWYIRDELIGRAKAALQPNDICTSCNIDVDAHDAVGCAEFVQPNGGKDDNS